MVFSLYNFTKSSFCLLLRSFFLFSSKMLPANPTFALSGAATGYFLHPVPAMSRALSSAAAVQTSKQCVLPPRLLKSPGRGVPIEWGQNDVDFPWTVPYHASVISSAAAFQEVQVSLHGHLFLFAISPFVKARGWWPGTWSTAKIFFWQFLFLWVDLALLKPMKNFPWDKCVIQATKNKAKSCSFLDAIRRCSCGPSADWLKIDGREIPVSTLETVVDTLRCALPLQLPSSSHLHVESLLFLLGPLRKPLKTKFTPAVSSVYSLSLSLSLSLPRVSTLEKKKSCPLSTACYPSKSSQSLSSKFVSPLDFAFNMWKSNCALDEDSASVTVVGSRTKFGVPALTGPLHRGIQRWMLPRVNVATKIQSSHSWQWLIQKEKKFRAAQPFPGILQCGAAFWPTTWLPCWMVATFVEPESQ